MSEITFRAATPDDAEEILNIYAPYVVDTAITFEYTVPTLEEFRGRITNTLKKYPYIVAVEEGRIVGYAYVSEFRERAAFNWCVETSIYVELNHKGKGIGKKLYALLEDKLKELGTLNLYACIAYTEHEDEHLTNDSVDFHKHLGYELCGRHRDCGYKFGRWYDVVWMEKMLSNHPDVPEEPKCFKGL